MATNNKKTAEPPLDASAVSDYKTILQQILDTRPSGTRQRLAEALGKNRSFISQISNPAYSVPIPARHVERILEICHFSPAERTRFLKAYGRAHPRRIPHAPEDHRFRDITLRVPDLSDATKNRRLETFLAEFAQRLARMLDEH